MTAFFVFIFTCVTTYIAVDSWTQARLVNIQATHLLGYQSPVTVSHSLSHVSWDALYQVTNVSNRILTIDRIGLRLPFAAVRVGNDLWELRSKNEWTREVYVMDTMDEVSKRNPTTMENMRLETSPFVLRPFEKKYYQLSWEWETYKNGAKTGLYTSDMRTEILLNQLVGNPVKNNQCGRPAPLQNVGFVIEVEGKPFSTIVPTGFLVVGCTLSLPFADPEYQDIFQQAELLRKWKSDPLAKASKISPFVLERDLNRPFTQEEIQKKKRYLKKMAPDFYYGVFPEEKL